MQQVIDDNGRVAPVLSEARHTAEALRAAQNEAANVKAGLDGLIHARDRIPAQLDAARERLARANGHLDAIGDEPALFENRYQVQLVIAREQRGIESLQYTQRTIADEIKQARAQLAACQANVERLTGRSADLSLTIAQAAAAATTRPARPRRTTEA